MSGEDASTAAHVLVSGRVQGVGFRAATRRRARESNVRGWVRNLADGRVEALVQGRAADVAAVVAWMRAGGPPLGSVDAIEVEPRPADEALTTFEVGY